MNTAFNMDDLLACPLCGGLLDAGADRFTCRYCRQAYPVRDGIPRLLPPLSEDEEQVKRSFNLEHARYLESRHLHFTPALADNWLEQIRLPREFFKDKLVLDAGCGSGRWTYALASLGARVVAMDFTEEGAAITRRETAGMGNVAVLQASVQRPPFQADIFDLVVSWGVLHHTPDTKASFAKLVPLIKKGGSAYIMVYEKHNPVKFACTAVLRKILQRFSEPARYAFCRRLMVRNRVLHLLLTHLIISDTCYKVTDPQVIATKQLGLYDAYAPVFNHLHTRQEVQSWFDEFGFQDVTLTSAVRFTKPFDVFRWGECGGAVRMRGVRA